MDEDSTRNLALARVTSLFPAQFADLSRRDLEECAIAARAKLHSMRDELTAANARVRALEEATLRDVSDPNREPSRAELVRTSDGQSARHWHQEALRLAAATDSAVAAEREACAKVAEAISLFYACEGADIADEIVAAIRARGAQ